MFDFFRRRRHERQLDSELRFATYLPPRRAARIDATVALRYE